MSDQELVTIKQSKLPAYLRGGDEVSRNAFASAGSGTSFPVLTIKGKTFAVSRGGEKEIITDANDPSVPARFVEVVIIDTNPNRTKVFYEHGYVEGSTDSPDCYSNNGSEPAADAESPQSRKCATCPHNQWGSRITESGVKAKACSDNMRVAVAFPDQLNDPMLLRVPPTSLKPLHNFGLALAKRGLAPRHVLTRVSFDFTVSHPALTFKAVDLVTEDEHAEIEEVLVEETETLEAIKGASEADVLREEAAPAAEEDEAPPKRTRRAAPAAEEDEAPPKRTRRAAPAAEEDEAPPKRTRRAAPAAEEDAQDAEFEDVKSDGADDGVQEYDDLGEAISGLADLDFDA